MYKEPSNKTKKEDSIATTIMIMHRCPNHMCKHTHTLTNYMYLLHVTESERERVCTNVYIHKHVYRNVKYVHYITHRWANHKKYMY